MVIVSMATVNVLKDGQEPVVISNYVEPEVVFTVIVLIMNVSVM